MKVYRPMVPVFLAEFTCCEFPLGCLNASVVVHHRRGREGDRLLDVTWWAASCWDHNGAAETEVGMGDIGWLVNAEGNPSHPPYHEGWAA